MCSSVLGACRWRGETVQARLDKLMSRGVIRDFGPGISPAALGYSVMAFMTLEIAQAHGHRPVARTPVGDPGGVGGAHGDGCGVTWCVVSLPVRTPIFNG